MGSTDITSNNLRELSTLLDIAPIEISFSDKHLKEQYPVLVNSLESITPLFDKGTVIDLLKQAEKLNFTTDWQNPHALPLISRMQSENEKIYALGDVHGSGPSIANFIDFIEEDQNRVGVILGDIFDRGLGFNAFMFVISRCLEYQQQGVPHRLIVLRGDHEEKFYNQKEGAEIEIKKMYGDQHSEEICERLWQFFNYLPAAYFVGKKEQGYTLWTIYSHALVHGDYDEYTIVDYENGNEIKEKSKVLSDINSKNADNILSLLSKATHDTFRKSSNLVNSKEITNETLVNTLTYNNGFTNGRIRQEGSEVYGREFTISTLEQWCNKYFAEGNNILKAIIVGHQHPFSIEYQSSDDKIHYNMQEKGYSEIIFNNDQTRLIVCGPGVYNLYGIANAHFPYQKNNIFFGFSRQYAICYDSVTNTIERQLIVEDTESKFSRIRNFIRETLLTEKGELSSKLYNAIVTDLNNQKQVIVDIIDEAKKKLLNTYFKGKEAEKNNIIRQNEKNTEENVNLLTAAKLYNKINNIISQSFITPKDIVDLKTTIDREIKSFEEYSPYRACVSCETIEKLDRFAIKHIINPIFEIINPIRDKYRLDIKFFEQDPTQLTKKVEDPEVTVSEDPHVETQLKTVREDDAGWFFKTKTYLLKNKKYIVPSSLVILSILGYILYQKKFKKLGK